MLTGSSLALKSLFSLCILHQQHSSISDRTALFILVSNSYLTCYCFWALTIPCLFNPFWIQYILHGQMVCWPPTNSETWVITQMLAKSLVGFSGLSAGVDFV